MSTRDCYVCRARVPDDEGAEDYREVVLRNGLRARACLRCWFVWPDAHKLYPALGFGRTGARPSVADLVELLRETNPARKSAADRKKAA